MYGFLKPDYRFMGKEERDTYSHIYCGQCSALGSLFGYPWRMLVSYDAAFFGLLVSAQQKEEPQTAKSWCVCRPGGIKKNINRELSSSFSACMAVILLSIKLADSQQEKQTYRKRALNSLCSRGFRKARYQLDSMGFPVHLLDRTLSEQQKIEMSGQKPIYEYAEPTSRFLGEMFKYTAVVTNNPANEETLYKIGYHLGRIIYLVDSCIDLIDDIGRKAFNAYLNAYPFENRTNPETANDTITDIIIGSMYKIRHLTRHIVLHRHEDALTNVLFSGFPGVIQQRIESSSRQLKKISPFLFRYAPHAAIASALVMFCATNAGAEWWPKEGSDNCACGYSCSESGKETGWTIFFDLMLNPCYYFFWEKSNDLSGYCCGFPFAFALQAPKAILTIKYTPKVISRISKWSDEIKEKHLKILEDIEQKKEDERKLYIQEKERLEKAEQEILCQKNISYLEEATADLRFLEDKFETITIFGADKFSTRYMDRIKTYLKDLSLDWNNDDFKNNKLIEYYIDKLTELTRQWYILADEADNKFIETIGLLYEVEDLINTKNDIVLKKEVGFLAKELVPDQLIHLLNERRWNDFNESLNFIVGELNEIKKKVNEKKVSY